MTKKETNRTYYERNREVLKARSLEHQRKYRKTARPAGSTRMSYHAMRQRCLNQNHTGYMNYGGRGITIDHRWHDFATFLEDMGERPVGMSLDRIDVDGPYCKSNCKWSTRKEQQNNRRVSTRKIT